ncbi:MAG: autotransporter outer membrane beta-barrel domain-containing protein [Methylococcales bacterium]
MNPMKKTMIGLCAAFACVSIAKASPDTTSYDVAAYDTTDYTMEAIEAARSKVTGGVLDGITQAQVDEAQAILDVGGIRTGVTQADIDLNISIVDNAQEMVDLAYITDLAVNIAVEQLPKNSYTDGVYDNDDAIDAIDKLLTGLGDSDVKSLANITVDPTSTILPVPVDNIPDGLAKLLSDAVAAAKFIVDGDVDEDGFGLAEPLTTAEDYAVDPNDTGADGETPGTNIEALHPDYIAAKAEFDKSLLVAQTDADEAAVAANKAVVDAIIAANAVYESIAAPQAIIDVGVLSTITEEDINEAWETTVLGVRVKTTQEQVEAAQEIVDAGLTVENTSFSFSKNTTVSRELYEYAKTVVRYTEQSLFKKSKYTSSDISKAEAIVAAGVIEAITEDQYNSAMSYVEMADLPDEALPSVAEAEVLLKKGVTTGVTQAKLNVAQSVVDAQKTITDVEAVGGNATSRDPVTQATVNKNIELLNLLTYAAEHFGTTTGTLGSNFEFENGEIDLETMQAIIELAEAQILVETGVMAGVTQEDIDDAQAILDASVIKEITQVQFDKAQAIVTLGLVEEVTQADIDEAQAIIDAGLVEGVTQTDIDAAQAKVDAGVEETQEQTLAEAEALIAEGVVEGSITVEDLVGAQTTIEAVTAEKLAAAEALVAAGVVEGVTAEQIAEAQNTIDDIVEETETRKLVMQVLVSNGASIKDLTPEQIVHLRGVKKQYDATYGENIVTSTVLAYNIADNDVDAVQVIAETYGAYPYGSSVDDKKVKEFVVSGGVDALKALINTGNVETALDVSLDMLTTTTPLNDFVTKIKPDVSGAVSGATAGVNAVGGAIGGHQQSVVVSSGKYGLKKHSLSVSKQLGMSSGDGIRSTGAWMKVFGSTSEMDMRDSISGYDAGASGIVVGIDKTFGDLMIGAAISVADIDVDGKSIANSSTDSDQFQGTLYGTMMMDSFYINSSFAIAHTSSDTSRTGLEGRVAGSYDTDTYAISLGMGVPIDMGSMAIIPQAVASYTSISPDSYTESGIGALHVAAENIQSFGIKAGIAVSNKISVDGGVIAPKVRLMADWDVTQEKAVVNSSWVGDVDNTVYSTSGAEPASLGAIIGAGVDYASDDGLYVLSLDYDLSKRSDFTSHAGSVKVRVNF